MNKKLFSTFLLIFLLGACRTPQNIAYFQGLDDLTDEQREAMIQKYVPRIGVDDALVIYVTSPDRDEVAQFSPAPFGYYSPGERAIGISATTQNLFTYLVDEFGYINFPILGKLKVEGLSINETTRLLESLIWETAPKAVIQVQIVNFKVGIVGEVNLPDIYNISTPRPTILELLAFAGDLTIYADRKNVWIHRDNNGEKVHEKLDLTDPMIFASPFYYLQQNDIVYVMPNDAIKRSSRLTTTDNTRVSFFSAIITTIASLITAIVALRLDSNAQ